MGLGLEGRLDNAIGSLSGGQRQSITLLMATLRKPNLLLLDEHTAALDPKSADQVIRLTDEVIRRDRLTTLMVTHSMHQAAHLGDRLIMMVRGRVLHDIPGRGEAAADSRRLARPVRGGAPCRTARRNRGRDAPPPVRLAGVAGVSVSVAYGAVLCYTSPCKVRVR